MSTTTNIRDSWNRSQELRKKTDNNKILTNEEKQELTKLENEINNKI